MHKPTIHSKTSNSIFTSSFYGTFADNVLFSSYMTVHVIQLKMYILRNVCFQFFIGAFLLTAQELITSFSTNTIKLVAQSLLEGA